MYVCMYLRMHACMYVGRCVAVWASHHYYHNVQVKLTGKMRFMSHIMHECTGCVVSSFKIVTEYVIVLVNNLYKRVYKELQPNTCFFWYIIDCNVPSKYTTAFLSDKIFPGEIGSYEYLIEAFGTYLNSVMS
jgi:hypothetical protein